MQTHVPTCSTLNLAPSGASSAKFTSSSGSDGDDDGSPSTDDDSDRDIDISFLSTDMEPTIEAIKVSASIYLFTPGADTLEMEELELDEPHAPTFSTLSSTMYSLRQASSQISE